MDALCISSNVVMIHLICDYCSRVQRLVTFCCVTFDNGLGDLTVQEVRCSHGFLEDSTVIVDVCKKTIMAKEKEVSADFPLIGRKKHFCEIRVCHTIYDEIHYVIQG